MPVVFGGAVTVTALYTIFASGGRLQANIMLWVGIIGMLISVVIITRNTPHAAPGGGGDSHASTKALSQTPSGAEPSP